MKIWKILVIWVMTVIIGGFLWPVVAAIIGTISGVSHGLGSTDLEMIAAIMGVAVVGSIPTIIVLIILHFVAMKNSWNRKLYTLILLPVQLFCGLITFYIIGREIQEHLFTLSLFLSFAPVGLIIWALFIYKSKWWPTTKIDLFDDFS